jgi:hypothetical protein
MPRGRGSKAAHLMTHRPAIRSDAGIAAPALLTAIAVATSPCAAQPSDKTDGRGVYLRFLSKREASGNLQKPPLLGMSFGGKQRHAVMDTGSTGIVVAASSIPDVDRLESRGPGTLTYTSSGRIMRGDWVVTPVTIAGANGASVTTAPIPVLAVRRIECLDNARNCSPNENPRHVAMIGIGFGRRGLGPPERDKNPFLNLADRGSGQVGARRGYVVTRDGVQVGLGGADPAKDYVTVPLRWNDERQDWSGAPACIAINDRTPAACGTVLPDTGVAGMFLAIPASQEGTDTLPTTTDRTLLPGTKVTISLAPDASTKGGIASYSFRVGDAADPLAPSRLTLVGHGDRPIFVNTSLHLFNGFDYLFDADKGVVGYRWNGRLAGGTAPARTDPLAQ